MNSDFKTELWEIWLVYFLYTAFIACLVQLVILPYILPQLHYGQGLMKNCDWTFFHSQAVEMSNKIKAEGWSALMLRSNYEHQSISGILSVVYALTVQKPWAFIPVNAVLHASSAVLLILIMEILTGSRKKAFLSSLPFMFFPSSALWYAQIHKDGFFIAGTYLHFYGFLLLMPIIYKKITLKNIFAGLAYVYSGAFLVWLIRPYGIQIMLAVTGIVAAVILAIFITVKTWKRKIPWIRFGELIICFFVISYILYSFASGGHFLAKPLQKQTNYAGRQNQDKANAPVSEMTMINSNLNSLETDYLQSSMHLGERIKKIISTKLAFLNQIRYGSATSGGKTLLDADIKFNNFGEYVEYLPRHLQIIFLAPFPNMWFEQGSENTSGLMRFFSAIEMSITYFFLLFFPFAVWQLRKKIETWVILAMAGGTLLFYGYSIVNIGTLYRFRYGFIAIFISCGLFGFIQFVELLKQKFKKISISS
ncbi:MAG: hypothetical protein PHU59_01925 [Candidatus Omnitrophica bacterium]|nr:hypothetical protein [Candidatus Omnitrophota bacterium]